MTVDLSKTAQEATARKPRLALMGEFSAGKSTLTNLLLGARPLPERVTATCLPPVWISAGKPGAVRELHDGSQVPVALHEFDSVPLKETRVIRLHFQAEVLESCDLIDCPGISDPNMPSGLWEDLLPEFDMVLWCTHATQAWRQSEAAVWETMPEELQARSVLVVTRFDKLTTERDRKRVITRVRRETDGLFNSVFPVSLTEAIAAGNDEARWQASGAHDLMEHLAALVTALAQPGPQSALPLPRPPSEATVASARGASVIPLDPSRRAPTFAPSNDEQKVLPRRVANPDRPRASRPRANRPS